MRPADFRTLLQAFATADAPVVLIGGLAATVHGSARFTLDVDLLYARDSESIERVVSALSRLRPRLRGAPEGLPFLWDAETVRRGLNFTLQTDSGPVDLLGEVPPGLTYESVLADAVKVELYGVELSVASLEQLIAMKRAAGRPKDLEALGELEALAVESGEFE